MKEKKELEKERHEQEVVKEVQADFKKRQKERIAIERQWELNLNFYMNNQYCDLTSRGDIYEESKDYYWQKRGVYNHITPIIETRLAKFSKIEPIFTVRPTNDDDKEIQNAKMGEKLLNAYVRQKNLKGVVAQVSRWSEICGSAFYKVVWDNKGGNKVGKSNDGESLYEGEVKVIAVPPFEVFPNSLHVERVSDLKSIIHAKAVSVEEVYEQYNVKVDGKEIDVFNLDANKGGIESSSKQKISGAEILIERYEAPTKKYPQGKLTIVCGNKLIYEGALPYKNAENEGYALPFIKQDALPMCGSFFGSSVIERLIPLQREYNAIKNRKHEFLNRLSSGVITIEDGSIDTDDLIDEGLSPGKVLVYRQGSKAPEMMAEITMPDSFDKEEEKLLEEFSAISGVSDVVTGRSTQTVNSGTAFELLVEQSNERLIVSAECIREAYLGILKQILRLYKQFVKGVKVIKDFDSFDKVKMVYVDKSTMTSDDVLLQSENELLLTPIQKKESLLKLYESGILESKNKKVKESVKERLLNLLGYKELADSGNIIILQEQKAEGEHARIRKEKIEPEVIDDNEVHIEKHTTYILSEYENLSQAEKENIMHHIKRHYELLGKANEIE